MTEFVDVDALLKIDESCAGQSKLVFGGLGANTGECANAGLRVFAATAAWLQKFEENHPAAAGFNETAQELKITGEELWEIIKQPPQPVEDPRIAKARGIDQAVDVALANRTLLQLMWRASRWGLADLRRLKLTAAAGYTRIEVESLGLLVLFSKRPDLARRWLNPNEDSRKFFSETQPEIKKIAKEHKLAQAYDHGSAVAQHVRFASAARGLRISGGNSEVLDQEFDPENPVSFHLGLAYFLRMQTRIFKVLPLVFTGLQNDDQFKAELALYTSLEDKTWWVMEKKYAKEIGDFEIET